MVKTQKIDMDFDYDGEKYWVCGEVTLESEDLTVNELSVAELNRYEDLEGGGFREISITLEDLSTETREALYCKMEEEAVRVAGEEEYERGF